MVRTWAERDEEWWSVFDRARREMAPYGLRHHFVGIADIAASGEIVAVQRHNARIVSRGRLARLATMRRSIAVRVVLEPDHVEVVTVMNDGISRF